MSAISRFTLAVSFGSRGESNLVVATILPKAGLSSVERQSLASAIVRAVKSLTGSVRGEIEGAGLEDLHSGEHPRPLCMSARERARDALATDPPDDPDVRSGYAILAELPWTEFDEGSKLRGVRVLIRGSDGVSPIDDALHAMQLHIPRHLVSDCLFEFIELVPTFQQRSWNEG